MFGTARALSAPQLVYTVPWETLLEKLKNHYSRAPSRITRWHTFCQRMQREGESIKKYMASLQSAALYCDFRNLDNILLDQLVCGVKDLRLQQCLLAHTELNLQTAMDEARVSEILDRSMAEIQHFQAATAPARKSQAVHHEESNQDDTSDDKEGVSHLKTAQRKKWTPSAKSPQASCLGCGRSHNRCDCRFKTAICRQCGKKGHLSQVCRAALPTTDILSEPTSYKKLFKKPLRRCKDCFAVSHLTAASPNNKIYLMVKLEGVPCKMEVDTSSSLISRATLQQIWPASQSNASNHARSD